jgi:hypothetical protein
VYIGAMTTPTTWMDAILGGEWRDMFLDAMTPRQRALLKNGRRVWVRIEGTKYMVCRSDTDTS